ncbi:hypothetical protein [Membranihabitans maritimus]|uniref:hypothetical protein n=1 Tax=Membranihabitans maritimus TaxID=2904244 RepID=UPI001F4167E0|nr:hypothetical protein [Membranihabitans maritimus]
MNWILLITAEPRSSQRKNRRSLRSLRHCGEKMIGNPSDQNFPGEENGKPSLDGGGDPYISFQHTYP